MTYAQQTSWRELQNFLPAEYRLNSSNEPAEEWWDHGGHRIHLDTYRNRDAPAKVILFHGVGTNGRQMTTILGRPLADLGYETIAIDMPTYGVTEVAPGSLVTYDEWVRIGSDLVDVELAKDDRPIVLYGLSAGGMEGYHVAALNRKVAGIVGMTFLDTSLPRVKTETGFEPITGRFSGELTGLFNKIGFGKVKVPMRYVSKMRALVNNTDAKKAWYRDKSSAGNVVTVAFLDSWLAYRPVIAPEEFDIAPVLLTQPSEDRWTPLHLAEPFLDRITRVPVTKVMLPGGGHYPLEKQALDTMIKSIYSFLVGIVTK